MKSYTELSLKEYLDELSNEEPVPGGGSVSAYVASLGMALTEMVGRISLKRKKKSGLNPTEEKQDDENRRTLQKMIESIQKTKKDALEIVNLDPQIFQGVMEASSQADQMEDALQNSFRLQADLAFLVVMAREWNSNMAGLVKGSIKNDLLVSASLLEAAFHGAYHTAMINVKYMKDDAHKMRASQALEELQKRFEKGNPP